MADEDGTSQLNKLAGGQGDSIKVPSAKNSSPFRIVIVEDHAFSAKGLAAVLTAKGEFEVVATATNGIDGIAEIKAASPDCAILDLNLPGANGAEVFAEARRWSPKTRFVVLTGMLAPPTFRDLVSNRINGIFLKSGNPNVIYDRIYRICQGEDVIAPEVLSSMDAPEAGNSLTLRELEVLHAIARGWSNSGIAEHLGISPKTVDSHRTTLMRKLGVHSTATLLVKAMRDGIVDLADNREIPPVNGPID